MKDKNYDPYRYWEDECAYDGAPISQDGTSLNTEMNVGVKSGWIPAGQVVHTDKASTYFTISKNNGYDMFDSMRSAIQQSQAPLIAGVIWYADWESPDGIVPDSYKQVMGGHATKIAGWKTINNIPYIVVQNSWGSEVGDGGLFYFSREISNKVFNQGVFVWSDTPNLIIQNLGFLAALLQNLLNLLRLVAGVFKQKNGSSI